MPRKYQHRRMGIYPDSAVRREEEKIERFLEDVSARGVAFEKANVPGTIVRVTPDGSDGGLRDHDHSRSGLGGNILGDPSKTITGRGTWEFAGQIGINKLAPTDRLHIIIPDLDTSSFRPSATAANNGWTPTGAATVHEAMDEETPDDTDYAENTLGSSATLEVNLTGGITPTVDTEHVLRLRIWDPSGAKTLTFNFIQTVTSIKTGSISATTTPTTFEFLFTEAEAALITNYADIRVAVSAGGGLTTRWSWTELAVPLAGAQLIERALVIEAGAGQRDAATNVFEMFDEDGNNLLKLGPSGTLSVGATNGPSSVRFDIRVPNDQSANIWQTVDSAGDTLFSIGSRGTFVGGSTSANLSDVTRLLLTQSVGQEAASPLMAVNTSAGLAMVRITNILTLLLGTSSTDASTLAERLTIQGGTAQVNDLLSITAKGTKRLRVTADGRLALNRATADAPLHAEAESVTVPAAKFGGNFTNLGQTDGPVVLIESVRTDAILGTSGVFALKVTLDQDIAFNDTGGVSATIRAEMDVEPDSFSSPLESGAFSFLTKTNGSEPFTGDIFGAFGRVEHLGSGLLTGLLGFNVSLIGTTGDITDAIGFNLSASYVNNPTVTRHSGIKILNPTVTGSAVLTEQRGIWLTNLTSAGTDWAIYSEGADSWFQDRLRTSAALRLIEAGGASGDDFVEIKAPTTVGTSYGFEVPANGPSNSALMKYAALSGTVTVQSFLTAARGDLIIGNSTPEWVSLSVGAANTVTKSDGTDVSWGTINKAHIDNRSRTDYIPANTWFDTLGPATIANQGTFPDRYTFWGLSTGVDQAIGVTWQLPADYVAGTALVFSVFWTQTGTSGFNWRARMHWLDITSGGNSEGASTTIIASITGSSSATALTITNIGNGTPSLVAGDMVRLNLEREGSNAGDSHPGQIRILGVEISYTADM